MKRLSKWFGWMTRPARLAGVVVIALWCAQTEAATLRVGKEEAIQSIRKAIDIAQPGDTILITGGVYREGNLRIEKPLVLLGINDPILDGERKYELLTIASSDVTVAGIVFRNTGRASMHDLAAVKLLNVSRVTVRDNRFEDVFFGIYLSGSSHSHICNNTLQATPGNEQDTGNGIHAWKSHNITIDSNVVRGHRDGIYFEFVTSSRIRYNTSEGNIRYGLHFMFSHDNEYRHNMFVRNGAGVAVMYTRGVHMINNTFGDNWGSAAYGLLLKDIRDSEVVGNKFVRNSAGIFMEGSSRITFRENSFTSNGYAIRLQASCDNNTFERNNFSSNTFDIVTNGSLVLNTIRNNYWDRYEGYDLDRDNTGDVPYRPVSMYSMIVERMPVAVLLWRSFLVFLLDRAERAMPAMTPVNLEDNAPSMKPHDLG
ncbi:MAG: nitrous oxide reductase family maturation protein NosD [Bacteroidota bacterium]